MVAVVLLLFYCRGTPAPGESATPRTEVGFAWGMSSADEVDGCRRGVAGVGLAAFE